MNQDAPPEPGRAPVNMAGAASGEGAPTIAPRGLPLRALVPNAVTMLALCSGATGIRFAISGEFDKAAAAIVIAGVLDGVDGRIARFLKGTSRFGAELDSLSDVTAFGLAPALILYLWTLQHLGAVGWVVALLYAVCCALRLARFNAALDITDLPKKRLGYTTGIPAPVGAGIVLAPLFFWLSDTSTWFDPEIRSSVAALITALTGLLMISALPGWGWQSIRVPRGARIWALLGVGLFTAALAQAPWITLTLLSATYLLAFPFAGLAYARQRAAELRQQEEPVIPPQM